jgi:hypothetical protein
MKENKNLNRNRNRVKMARFRNTAFKGVPFTFETTIIFIIIIIILIKAISFFC